MFAKVSEALNINPAPSRIINPAPSPHHNRIIPALLPVILIIVSPWIGTNFGNPLMIIEIKLLT